MTRRRLELAVLAFGALFVIVLLIHFRPGRRPAPSAARDGAGAAGSTEAGQPTTVLKGFDYAETVRGKPLFRIHADRTLGFGAAAGLVPDAYALEKVSLTVYPDAGAPVTVLADRADYDRRTNAATLKGHVRWSDEHGAVGETGEVAFDPTRRVLQAPGALTFSRGAFVLNASRGRYDLSARELVLEGPVRGSGTGEDSGGLTELSSDAAVYRRDRGEVELSGSVRGSSRSGDRIACDRLLLKAAAETNRLEWARAEGNVRGVLASAVGPKSGTGGHPRPYAGDGAAIFFDASGAAKNLSLTGAPAMIEEPPRRVRARTIDVAFAGGHPVSARADGAVRVESDESSGEADRGALGFTPSGEIDSATLEGHVRMKAGERSGAADRAVELPSQGAWLLTGDGPGSASVESAGSRITASRIEIDEKKRTLKAEGDARSVFTPAADRPRPPALIGDATRPTYGKADRIALDDASRVATLSGRASLWQDASSLFGDDITLNDTERTLVAVGNVRAILLPSGEAAARRGDRNLSIITARRLTYRETASVAVFEGSARMTRGGWRASSDKATAELTKERKVERVELTGDVSMSDQTAGRSGKAERVIDWPAQEKTVLEGSPAWVVDGEGNRASGAVLTIAGRGRSVEITAPAGGKTETVHRTRG